MLPLWAILMALATTGNVQYGPNTCKFSSGVMPCAYTSGVTTGNRLIVVVGVRTNNSAIVSGITDTVGTSYSKLKSNLGSFSDAEIWAGTAAGTGANTVSVTMSAAYAAGWVIPAEYAAASWTLTTSGTSTATSGSVNPMACGAFTPADNGVLIIGVIFDNNNLGGTASLISTSPMVTQVSGADATLKKILYQDYIMPTATSITPGLTDANSAAVWSCASVALKPAAVRRRQPTIE